MDRLVILEYSTGTVHVYDINMEEPVNDEYISNLGYNVDDCYWMTGQIDIAFHSGVVK